MVDDTKDMQRIASPANKMIAAWYLTKIDEAADGYYESISLTRTQKHWGENIWWRNASAQNSKYDTANLQPSFMQAEF